MHKYVTAAIISLCLSAPAVAADTVKTMPSGASSEMLTKGVGAEPTAQNVVPFVPGEKTRGAILSPSGPVACSFADKNLPKDTVVIAAGGYTGRTLNFQIDQSGQAATQFDVAVHADRPVALLLAAYEPTVWAIGWTGSTRIAAVYLTGYHRQVVAGLPKNVPVITSSYTEKGTCGYNYIGADLTWVNPKARQVFGAEVTRVYNKASNGVIDIVESKRPKTAYMTSPDVTPDSFRNKKQPLAGAAGLEEAVATGIIRPATAADIKKVQAHYRALAPKSPQGRTDVPPVAGASPNAAPEIRTPPLHRAYVVVKRFVYPAGLYGGNLATFVVPKGVPKPTGNPGHSTVIDLSSARPCAGPLCR